MKDLEERMRTLELARPSARLNQRMDQLFAGALPPRRRAVLQRHVPLWVCLVACVVCATAGVVARGRSAPAASQAPTVDRVREVYVLLPKDDVPGNVFDWTQSAEPFLGGDLGRPVVVVSGPTDGRNESNGAV